MEKNNQKNEIKKEIKFLKSSSFEIKYRMYTDALIAYLKSLTTFGFNNPYTKECFNVVKEIRKMLKEEKRILTMLYNHIDNIRLNDLDEMISEIDDLGYDAYFDYSYILDNIYTACEIKDKERIVRSNKDINSIVTNDECKEKVYSLIQKGSFKK